MAVPYFLLLVLVVSVFIMMHCLMAPSGAVALHTQLLDLSVAGV